MMNISNLLTRNCNQTAVYWGNPVNDAYGHITYDDPIEIKCRWEEKVQILGTISANQIIGYNETSRAIVFLTQDVDQEGCLYLGTLSDLDDYLDSSGGTYIDPRTIPNTHIIKRFEKTPALGSTTDFLRKAFLTPWLS